MRIARWSRITISSFAMFTLWLPGCGSDRSIPPPPPSTFSNPLLIQIPAGGTVQDCPDPSIIRGQQPGDTFWYMYCTTDPLNDTDKDSLGNFNFHLITMHKTSDLVHWSYLGDVFNIRPAWVAPTAGLWAPAIKFFNNKYFLYYAASDTSLLGGGRSANPVGPFLDSHNISLLDSRVGGTPVISMNGNRWVGPGHNAVFTDMAGQDWFLYHAIDRNAPYFAGAPGFTKRPGMLDALDWVNEWPVVRGGLGPSDAPQPAPAAQPGDKSQYTPTLATPDQTGQLMATLSHPFNSPTLSPQWSWARRPASGTFGLTGQEFQFDTQNADLFLDSNNASVLVEAAPASDYIVETRLNLNVPAVGCCQNFVQAGVVIYGDDDNYVKLVHVSIFDTRQTEFAKELAPVPNGFPRYGSPLAGPPSDWTWLRIVRRAVTSGETYTAYSGNDGQTWIKGGTWTHSLGAGARIGLVSMGGSGFTAKFYYVHVSTLAP